MDRPDALIVGAGPAGSTCARDLVRAGLDVLVIERAQFPRQKPCAGWITPQVFETLAIDPAGYADGRTLQPIEGFRVSVCGRAATDAAFGKAVSYGIRRCEFDHYLLQRSGARVAMGTAVERLERTRDRWIVNGEIEAPIVVGAGGHFCPVAAHVAPHAPAGPLVVAQEIEVPLSAAQATACRVRATLPALYFCPDLKGYGWVFRKGDFLNVGFGRQDRIGFAARSRRFCDWLASEGELPPGIPTRWHGHAYLLWGEPSRPCVGEGFVLVGDAAGLAVPASGEGIRTAIESGLLAARAIVAAYGVFSRDRLEAYRGALVSRYGIPPDGRGRLAWLPQRLGQSLGARLIGQPWFARQVLVARWFLRMHQPALV
jgi:geranylgeranyl reductase family protein